VLALEAVSELPRIRYLYTNRVIRDFVGS
jgi:hypothetical protein